MPYHKEWTDPEEVVRYRGVVVHEYYAWEEDEFPQDYQFALFKPDNIVGGEPQFLYMEGVDPEMTVTIAEVCALLDVPAPDKPRLRLCEQLLHEAIDAGILQQDGFHDKPDPFGWAKDTMTLSLPLAVQTTCPAS